MLSLTALVALPLSAVTITPQQFGSINPSLVNQIIIQQTTETGLYGIRYEDAQYRSALQTFTWEGTGDLTGLGIKLAANGNNLNGTAAYYLRIFKVSALTAGPDSSVTSPALREYEFSLTGDYRTITDYLYFALPASLTLENGGTYMFQIINKAEVVKRLSFATAAGGTSTYAHGVGYTHYSSTPTAPTTISDNSGGVIKDYVFFLTGSPAIPEPRTLGLLIGCIVGMATLGWRKIHRTTQP